MNVGSSKTATLYTAVNATTHKRVSVLLVRAKGKRPALEVTIQSSGTNDLYDRIYAMVQTVESTP